MLNEAAGAITNLEIVSAFDASFELNAIRGESVKERSVFVPMCHVGVTSMRKLARRLISWKYSPIGKSTRNEYDKASEPKIV